MEPRFASKRRSPLTPARRKVRIIFWAKAAGEISISRPIPRRALRRRPPPLLVAGASPLPGGRVVQHRAEPYERMRLRLAACPLVEHAGLAALFALDDQLLPTGLGTQLQC